MERTFSPVLHRSEKPSSHNGEDEELLPMDDDIDVIKMGSWINMHKGFEKKDALFVYWIFLCLLSTIIQIYFYYKIIY